jgi:hypothetical protein
MSSFAPLIRLRPEVAALDWERIRGHILFKDLISPLDSLEKNTDWLFSHTFPTTVLQAILREIRAKLEGKSAIGAFLLEGGLGSGKSHLLTFLYHLFTKPAKAREWLAENRLDASLTIPEQANVVALPLLEFPDQPLWRPMFERLNRPDLIPDKTATAPTSEAIRQAFGDRSVVLLIDEIVGWYGTLPGTLKVASRNFLQNLAEESLRRPDVFLFVSILSGMAAEEADTDAIKSRLTRPAFYSEPLMRRDDRLRIVFFRLFEDKVNRIGAEPIIERYVSAYGDLREQLGFDWDLAEMRAKLRESHPFHPNLLDVVFDRYATIPQTQAARGALGLLAELVVREQAQVDLLLPADVSPDTYYEWLSRVNFELTKRVLDDLESLAGDEDAVTKERILRTAFLYSLGEVKQPGATDAEIFMGTVRPGEVSALDVDGALREMTATVEHLHRENGRWVVKLEENVDALVYRQAMRVEPEEVHEIAREAIKAQLKGLAYGVYVSPPDTIPDTPSCKVAVFLERQTNGELEAFFEGRQWQNALLVIMPKARQDRALDAEAELLARKVKAARTLLEDKGRADAAVRRKLQGIARTSLETLCDNKIGVEWDAVRWFLSEDNKLGWRFDPVRLAATEVSEKMLSYGNVTDLKKDVRTLLSREEDRGLPYRELRDSFGKYRGLAVLLDDARIREALRDIEGELVFIGQDGRRSDRRLPSWYQDAQVILAQYAPARPPEREVPEEEKEAEPQIPLWGERGEVGEKVSIGVSTGEVKGPETQTVSWEGRNVSTPALNVEREQDTTQFYEEAKLTLVLDYGGPQAAGHLADELRALADLIKAKGPRQVRTELSLRLPDMLSPEEVLKFLKGFDDRDTEKARLEGKVRRGG